MDAKRTPASTVEEARKDEGSLQQRMEKLPRAEGIHPPASESPWAGMIWKQVSRMGTVLVEPRQMAHRQRRLLLSGRKKRR